MLITWVKYMCNNVIEKKECYLLFITLSFKVM